MLNFVFLIWSPFKITISQLQLFDGETGSQYPCILYSLSPKLESAHIPIFWQNGKQTFSNSYKFLSTISGFDYASVIQSRELTLIFSSN